MVVRSLTIDALPYKVISFHLAFIVIFITAVPLSKQVYAQDPWYLYFGSRFGLTASFQGFNVSDRFLQTTKNPYIVENYQSFNSKSPNFSMSLYSGFSKRQLSGYGFMLGLDIGYARYKNKTSYSEIKLGLTNESILNTGNIYYNRSLESLHISPKIGVFTISPIRLKNYYPLYIEAYTFVIFGAARHKYNSIYTRPSNSEQIIDTTTKWLPTIGAELGVNLYVYRGIYFGVSFSEVASINNQANNNKERAFYLAKLPKVLATSTFMITFGFTFNYRLDINQSIANK